MRLTLQTHFYGQWHHAATLELKDDTAGYQGASIVDYDLDYFVTVASAEFAGGKTVRDHRALSVRYPVDLENRYSRSWPPFLLDLMPQGHARRKLAEHLSLAEGSRASDLPLLLRSATGGIGNIRIKEAAEAETERLRGVERQGVTEAEILERSDRFMEVADRFGMLASGSSGLQGEWPKVSMTQANDGLYYPDSFVTDDEAVRHVIVKLVRSSEPVDRLILEGEALYSRIAQEIGLNVHEPSTYAESVLIIPRFDRKKKEGGGTVRLGQESLVSAIGVADFGHVGSHEAYIDVLRQYSANPFADIVEYLKRDIANLALGNPDNHGRNSALSKHQDGTIRLSPLFDFAPMRLAKEGIVRSTRWAMMRDGGRDHLPDWKRICAELIPDPDEQKALAAELSVFAEYLRQTPAMAKDMGGSAEILERAMGRCIEIAESVLAACQ
ncbi:MULTISPECIES: type II toxin-antitoxin system HipA family toxin [Agrobacterium tumefaciens complex]|uniref:type II toxin-antitoxin system HipA family toxin n=1 Tax=Agrobacterium tumefaciens complex TaxID=1183400 RepID=UPI00037CBF27|nr:MULTISPECIES: type II toxin-antitoxin system HipA family toxin [Agrobacterium tumefaciens complex]EPR18534.1 phosphatidylinositol kinase [Agrobacterium radiobacter DSM 30147]KAB0455391.1 type II toxin-antitoxin system HipA family toxin [Agrobacterium tumefaciens]KWT78858.1 phosphatidylinositol kinase [Agrobacterium radiobacter]NIB12760.1 type II toxin-antitoxin system HipA family toxin [Agrobacterium radiobacter]OOO40929.1 phosphatidylinositol kinase [Agrobacterium radiobacter]